MTDLQPFSDPAAAEAVLMWESTRAANEWADAHGYPTITVHDSYKFNTLNKSDPLAALKALAVERGDK